MERQRWESIEAFGQAAYEAAKSHGCAYSTCKAHCSGQAKGKVRTSDPAGFSLHYLRDNLNAVAQAYLNSHTLIQRVSASPYAPSTVDCRGPITVEETISNVDWTYSKLEVTTSISTSFGVEGGAEYKGTSLSGSYNQQNGKTTDQIDTSADYERTTMKIIVGPDAGIVDFYLNNYTCSDSVVLEVDYDFDQINFHASCTYKDKNTGVKFDGGKHEHYWKTFDISSLDMNPYITVPVMCLFNVNYKDEWPSWETRSQ